MAAFTSRLTLATTIQALRKLDHDPEPDPDPEPEPELDLEPDPDRDPELAHDPDRAPAQASACRAKPVTTIAIPSTKPLAVNDERQSHVAPQARPTPTASRSSSTRSWVCSRGSSGKPSVHRTLLPPGT
jgi:hypothetical protein